MKTRVNKILYEIHFPSLLLAILMLYFGISSLRNYIQAKEVEKSGQFLKAIIQEKFCKSRGGSYTIVELLGEGYTKELQVSKCKEIEIGDTTIVKFLSPSKVILQYQDGEVFFGSNNLCRVIIGFLLTFLILFIAINKSSNLINKENYILRRKKYFYRKGEKHSQKK